MNLLEQAEAAVAPYLAVIRIVLWAVLALALFVTGCRHGEQAAEQKLEAMQVAQAKAETVAQQDARATEHASAERANEIAESYERGKQDAQVTSDRVAADLRAGNLKLRDAWAGCETKRLSDATASAVEPDALAASRDALAGNIVRVGAECDAQIRGLQALVIADRSGQ